MCSGAAIAAWGVAPCGRHGDGSKDGCPGLWLDLDINTATCCRLVHKNTSGQIPDNNEDKKEDA